MEPNSTQEKLNEEEEEEEALSLCDLPVDQTGDNNISRKLLPESPITVAQEEFDFCTRSGLFSEESEMCAADEVFFEGRILPLRRSLSTTCFQSHGKQFNLCEYESLDHVSLRGFKSISSRSSSLGSDQNSSSRCSSSTTTTISTPRIPEPNAQEQFHTHQSTKPQVIVTVTKQTSFGNQSRKALEFFRRSSNFVNKIYASRNNRSSSNSNMNADCRAKRSCSSDDSGMRKHFFKQLGGKSGGLWRGCKYSVETVQSDMVMIKGGTKSTNKKESTTEHAVKEKVLELNMQSHGEKIEKKTMSLRRTSEWIKELSDQVYPYEETLIFNA